MGPSGTYEGTYIGMMDHNANTIAGALGGKPVKGGFRAWKKSQEAANSAADDGTSRSDGA